MSERLDTYLQTNGGRLPEDQLNYIYGKMASLCVFCNEKHMGIPVYQFPQYKSWEGAYNTGSCTCEKCLAPIVDMEDSFEGESLRDPTDVRNAVINTPDLFYNAEMRKINDFIELGLFDYSVHSLYSHHDPAFLQFTKNICYFCDEEIGVRVVEDYSQIQVPRTSEEIITGGKIFIHSECRRRVEKIAENPTIFVKHPKWYYITCCRCTERFPVVASEHYDLQMNDTDRRVMCSRCVNESLNDISLDDPLIPERISIMDDGQIFRFVEIPCEHCYHPFSIDITVSLDVTKSINLDSLNRRCCFSCLDYGGRKPLHSFLMNNNRYVILIYRINRFKYMGTAKRTFDGVRIYEREASLPSGTDSIFRLIEELKDAVKNGDKELW